MAIATGTAILLAAGVGAGAGILASGKAAKAQTQAAAQASDVQREGLNQQMEMFYKSREDLAPWREAGQRALGTLEERVAAGPGEFEKSPYYNFLLEEGVQARERGAAARGRRLGGAQQKELTRFGQGLASTDYGNFLNQYYQSLTPLQSLSGVGQTATRTTAGLAENVGEQGRLAAAGIGQNILAGGRARASGYINTANVVGDVASSAARNYLIWRSEQDKPPYERRPETPTVPVGSTGFTNPYFYDRAYT